MSGIFDYMDVKSDTESILVDKLHIKTACCQGITGSCFVGPVSECLVNECIVCQIVLVGVTGADIVHDVIAIGGLYNAGIAGLPDGIEAPVIKAFHGLTFVDVFVQAAVGVGASICRVRICKLVQSEYDGH